MVNRDFPFTKYNVNFTRTIFDAQLKYEEPAILTRLYFFGNIKY
jgi:hypothetical protein